MCELWVPGCQEHQDSEVGQSMDVTGSVETKDPNDTNKEVRRIYEDLFGSVLFDKVEHALHDVVELFDGKYPGYRKCDTGYHDLEHTLQVYLAVARIFDGFIREDHGEVSKHSVVLGLVAALGHDTGFIKEMWDAEGSGAKYTLVHTARSGEFMEKYLPQLGFDSLQVRQVQNIIGYTGIPSVHSPRINLTSDDEREIGYILGTADYLGQMSAPDYLEKLPILYEEFKEGGVTGYTSAQDLMERTPSFFEDVVMRVLSEDFHSVYQLVASHFGGKNLYVEGIKKNMELLRNYLRLETQRPSPSDDLGLKG
jgi:hypothetical protein